MPELLTLYPDVVLEVLTSAPQVRCGSAAGRPSILKNCPQSYFCSLPGGELCVYGLDEREKMNQFTCSGDCFPRQVDYDDEYNEEYDDEAVWLDNSYDFWYDEQDE